MAKRLDGKVVIITGGARGQGAAEAKLFGDEGAIVYITDVLTEDGKATAAATGATFIQHDVTQPDQWQAVVDQVNRETGRIDGLVNNAGILRWVTMSETSLDTWNQVVAVNQTGVLLGMQAVAPTMKKQRSGSIVNISSIGGMRGGSPCFAYAATKWAVRGMSKGAAQELGPYNVRVNSVHPGIIDTPMMEGHDLGAMATRVPLQRYAGPEEVGKLVLWLLSDDSAYANGGEFTIDGGMTA